MPDAAPPRLTAAPPPILRRDAEFTGLVLLPRAARIDGRVFGTVLASGAVWIGETACVQARIEAEEVVVAGEVRGTVTARRRADLLASARLHGELHTPRLTLADGCFLEGRCRAGVAGDSEAPSS
jgi:cytoskeletal protein CcmA (bactofilin family)